MLTMARPAQRCRGSPSWWHRRRSPRIRRRRSHCRAPCRWSPPGRSPRHDHARSPSGNTAIAGFDRGTELGVWDQSQDRLEVAQNAKPLRIRRPARKSHAQAIAAVRHTAVGCSGLHGPGGGHAQKQSGDRHATRTPCTSLARQRGGGRLSAGMWRGQPTVIAVKNGVSGMSCPSRASRVAVRDRFVYIAPRLGQDLSFQAELLFSRQKRWFSCSGIAAHRRRRARRSERGNHGRRRDRRPD